MLIYLHGLRPYVAEWLQTRYGKPARFPRRSIVNTQFAALLSRPPRTAAILHTLQIEKDKTAFPLYAPTVHGKAPATFCYLSRRAEQQLRVTLTRGFILDLLTYYTKRTAPADTLRERTLAFMEKRGISTAHLETLQKLLYRERKKNFF